MNYVVGFLFNKFTMANGVERTNVSLIRKTHPEWQAGRLNGIGGKVGPDEESVDAMEREFLEETGALIEASRWRMFCEVHLAGGNLLLCYEAQASEEVETLRSDSEEVPGWYGVKCVLEPGYPDPQPIVDNLRWMLPLAMDTSRPFASVQLQSRDPVTGDET